MALKPFTFEEVSPIIPGLFAGMTSKHERIGFKDAKPSPGADQTGSLIGAAL